MKLIQQLPGVRIVILIELHCIPAVLAPVLPVLHQHIDWNFSPSEFGSGIQNFLLAVISLAALPVSVGPSETAGLRP